MIQFSLELSASEDMMNTVAAKLLLAHPLHQSTSRRHHCRLGIGADAHCPDGGGGGGGGGLGEGAGGCTSSRNFT